MTEKPMDTAVTAFRNREVMADIGIWNRAMLDTYASYYIRAYEGEDFSWLDTPPRSPEEEGICDGQLDRDLAEEEDRHRAAQRDVFIDALEEFSAEVAEIRGSLP